MSKGGVTKRIEDAIKALENNQIKKALYLTENNPKLERHHQWIEEAARTCLAKKDDKAACQTAIKSARDKIRETATAPLDDSSLEGLEEYLSQRKPEQKQESLPQTQPGTDRDLYENCEECHVATAASTFADICAGIPEEAGSCELIGRSLENENTEPADWIRAMIQTAETAQGRAKEEMVRAINDLTEYLQKRNSPFLKALDREDGHDQTNIIPPHNRQEETAEGR